jgi:hypothetical protein
MRSGIAASGQGDRLAGAPADPAARPHQLERMPALSAIVALMAAVGQDTSNGAFNETS